MTPAQLDNEVYWLGWRMLAAKTFFLRPAEAHALALMVRYPGRVLTFEVLATFDGDGLLGSRNFNGSRSGMVNRIVRLRAKLDDVGCERAIQTVGAGGPRPSVGYVMSPASVGRVCETLRFACGVAEEMAA